MVTENHKDIALKAWEVYQGLAKGMGESAWKIRAVYFATSAALIAYTYNSSSPILYLLASVLCVLFFVLESGYRRLQDQYIEKSIAIERTLNDFIANDDRPEFPESIGTDVDTPRVTDLLKLLALKRIIFWLPYFVLFLLTLVLFVLDVRKI
ncbi:hypothetical protein [Stutzerimonas kunmingensis]|uniref:hypothetical protein n=1 Tax=Stutzerimonas kunmingensis TaxID=1211807 RepID=UPI0024204B29|nr:hypothetical protein [Stutzerimonas kunmingensis]